MRLLLPLAALLLATACPRRAEPSIGGSDDVLMDRYGAELEQLRSQAAAQDMRGEEVCPQSERVCTLSAQTCQVAARQADRQDFQEQCASSREACATFRDACRRTR
jgi:hypothetical protein